MKYVTDTTIWYIYICTYTQILQYIYPNPALWCLLAFECIWLVFFVEIWGRFPKNGFMMFHGYHIVQPPQPHFLICLPSYERWRKRWFSNLISQKTAGIHSLKLGKLPSIRRIAVEPWHTFRGFGSPRRQDGSLCGWLGWHGGVCRDGGPRRSRVGAMLGRSLPLRRFQSLKLLPSGKLT